MLIPSTPTPNTILLKGALSRRYEEGRAGGTIKPGHLIALNSSGNLIVHPTAGGVCTPVSVAIEDGIQGKTIDDAYAATDLVRYVIPQNGDVLYMLLKAGENAPAGGITISAGDGTVKNTTGTPTGYVGRYDEAVDNSGGSDPVRIRVRFGN